jgi:hypothetical protein
VKDMDRKHFRKSLSLMMILVMALSLFCFSFSFVCAESGPESAFIEESTVNIIIPKVMWKGGFQQQISVYSGSRIATVTGIKSNNTKVIQKVKGQMAIKPVNTGSAIVTVKYKFSDWEKGSRTVRVTVKKYPNQIKSLKVNGKTVTIKKNKFTYEVNKYTGTKAAIKMTVKKDKGWKISDAYGFMYKGSKSGQMAVTVAKIKNGKSISFPKKYKNANINIIMENAKGESIRYVIYLYR